jgi:putative ABC transport system permease protein
MEAFLQDVRYASRTLRRDLGFFLAAVSIMGVGIGASATIFSVVNTLLIRPLPFRDPAHLVWITNNSEDPSAGWSVQTVQVNHFLDLRRQNQSLSDLAAYFAFYGVGDSKLTGQGEPERLTGVPVSQNFFPLLGIQPEFGRLFTAEECKWNGPKAVLLSQGLWKRRFASDPSIVGKPLILDDQPVTVVGVLPASFDFGSIFAPGSRIDLYFPFPLSEETNRWGNTLAIVGRLKAGTTLQNAQAEFSVLGARIAREHPERNNLAPRLAFLADHITRRLRPALLLLACAVGVVMLIVCANLSNLLLARGAARQKEIAIRTALGAARGRLVQQILTESVLLSSTGAILGLVLAVGGTRFLAHLSAVSIPLLESVRIDGSALGFTVLTAVLTGLLLGLVPALEAPNVALNDMLKDMTRGSTRGQKHAWTRSALVISEIALACVLLAGAGLLIRSFVRVLDVNLGFRPETAAALRIDPSSSYSTQAKRNAYFTEALHRILEVSGIEAAGLSDALPLGRNRSWGVAAKGQVYTRNNYPEGFVRVVSNGYFKAMGIPFRAGRDFNERDTPDSLHVIIINETLAETLWPGQNPLGQIMSADRERTVVGVVGDVRHLALETKSGSEFYLPIRQTEDYASVDLVVRTSLPPHELAARVREALMPLDPNLPTASFRTLQQLVDKAASPRRFVVLLLGGFAIFALLLAALGIYAVISYSVSQRHQEIGIRMALGASPARVRHLILGETLGLAVVGIVIGLAGALLSTRLAASLLYDVAPTDPLTFAGMMATLAAVAALAGYLPALRAARIEPVTLLRAE